MFLIFLGELIPSAGTNTEGGRHVELKKVWREKKEKKNIPTRTKQQKEYKKQQSKRVLFHIG